MTPQQKIQETIKHFVAMKTAIGVDKKWLNKTIARLEEAEAFAAKIVLPGSLAANEPSTTGIECICPAGAVDTNCPKHGGSQ